MKVFSKSFKETPDHVTGNSARKAATKEAGSGETRRLAELVTSREGHGVGDRQNEGDHCLIESYQLVAAPHSVHPAMTGRGIHTNGN